MTNVVLTPKLDDQIAALKLAGDAYNLSIGLGVQFEALKHGTVIAVAVAVLLACNLTILEVIRYESVLVSIIILLNTRSNMLVMPLIRAVALVLQFEALKHGTEFAMLVVLGILVAVTVLLACNPLSLRSELSMGLCQYCPT
ncbi:hypothetical protein LguiB_026682 [Lonicera macranthoides]